MASITNGLYEIYPAVAKPGSIALDVSGSGIANGTNVIVWGCTGNNNQKWYVKQETTGKWSIRSVHSGKYLDVSGGVAANYTNIQVWEDNDLSPQRWKITKVDEVTVDGVTCVVATVGSWIEGSGNSWMMDLRRGLTDWNTNVRLFEANGQIAQKWIFVPTTAEDPTMAVPYNLGACLAIGKPTLEPFIPEDTPFYPSWVCAPSWINSGGNYYEMRYRTRSMKPAGSTWGNWSTWTAWSNANTQIATDGSRQNWAVSPLEVDYAWSAAKNCEMEIQVRSASTGSVDEDPHHSKVASRTLRIPKKPDVELLSTGWSPEGLRVAWTSDYTTGTTYLTVHRIEFDGVIVYNSTEGYRISGAGSTGSGLIPADILRKWPQNGQIATITYNVGYDQQAAFNDPQTESKQVMFNTGSQTISPVFVENGAQLLMVVRDYGNTRAWITFDEQLIEMWEDPSYTVSSGYMAFDVPYPMRKAFKAYASTSNAAGTQWANATVDHAGVNRYANAWTWNGGSAYLVYSPERPSIATTYDPVYSAEVLDGREHEAVQFARTIKVQKTVSGDLLPNDTSSIADFEALLKAGHALFRSMNGEIFDAAITSVNINEVNDMFAEVSVQMIIETI